MNFAAHALLWPQALWLLLLLPALCLWRLRRGAPVRLLAADPGGLPRSLRQRLVALPALLFGLAFALSVLALARPVERLPLPREHEGVEVMLVLDVSSSMRAHDLDPQRDRLQVAVEAAADFIAARPEDRIGLVAFARWADLRCPPTLDHEALLGMLREEQPMEEDGAEDATGIGAAVALATDTLESGGPSKVVVLLTDGEENLASPWAPREIAPLHAAQYAEAAGVRVHAITVGSGRRAEDGSWEAIDTGQVEQLAERTGGRSWTVRDAGALRAVYAEIDAMETAPAAEQRYRTRERFLPPVRAALLLAVLGLLLAVGPLRVRPAVAPPSRIALFALTLVCGLAAALDPRGAAVEAPPTLGAARVVCCLDLSRSMLAADLSPSRLRRAQRDLRDLAEGAPGEQFALVLFAGEARLRVPLTRDADSFARLAEQAHPSDLALGGTELGLALQRAAEALGEEGGSVLLLSDGEDRGGRGLAAAEELARRGIEVHAVGYGTERGARIAIPVAGGEDFVRDASGEPVLTALDDRGLRAIAARTGGTFRAAAAESQPLLRLWGSGALRAVGTRASEEEQRRPLYAWPLAAALLFGMLAAARGGREQR